MSARTLQSNDDALDRRYRSLLAVTESISSHTNLPELFKVLPNQLRPVVEFDAVAVVLYDQTKDVMRLHVFETSVAHSPNITVGITLPVTATPEGVVWQTQEALLLSPAEVQVRFPDVFAQIGSTNINTTYSIPLTSLDRRLGAITFGSSRVNAYIESDLEFLRQVAKQVAVAVDSVINLERAAAERDRKQLLLEVGQAVVTNLSLGELFRSISACLKRVIKHDLASVVLVDPDANELRVHTLEAAHIDILKEGMVVPWDGTPAGLCIKSRATVRRDKIDFDEFFVPEMRMAYAMGLRCGCSVPLIAQDEVVGCINLGSFHEAAFSEEDAELLEQIAGPFAIAVQNALNFLRAERERDRRQLLLDINNAVVTNLSLRELMEVISDCLDRAVQHDVASIAIYEPDRAQFRLHTFDLKFESALQRGIPFPVAGTPAGVVFESHQTLRVPRLTEAEFPAEIIREAIRHGVISECCIPLIAHDKFLGVLEVASRRPDAFTSADAELLTQVAGQIAIAVQNSLNFEAANRERARAEMLLEINNAITSNLDMRELIQASCACLRKYFSHDFGGMALYVEEADQLVVHSLDLEKPDQYLIEGSLFPIEGTLNGLAFTTGQTLVRNHFDPKESAWPLADKFFSEQGLRSVCFLPMIFGGRTIGVLNLGSKDEDAFGDSEVELLTHIAGQIALAVQNSVSFDRAKKAKERAQLLLEANNAVATNLELKALLRNTSACLRPYFNHDLSGLALFDEQRNQLIVHGMDRNDDNPFTKEGVGLALEGSPMALAFATGKRVLRGHLDTDEFPAEELRRGYEAGWRSFCNVPLITRDRKLGVLGLISFREDAFNDGDADLLESIAGQVALAVENTQQYREIESLKNLLASEKHYLEEEIQHQYDFSGIVGQSAALRRVLQQVQTVAPTDSTVLLIGETGTGKELIARAIHDLSGRKERTLVKLNCAAIPTGLLESELFGHEKGAFTGAVASRIGRFELAHKGTLLLDEIGEIPLELQPKLLRVLQEHEFERLGSSRTVKTDARLIAATNCDLAQMVEDKQFRRDLYYRLDVFPITIPPLRERTGDIPLLVSYFTQKHAARMNRKIQTIPSATMDALSAYHWPGNVRELENFIERSVILSPGSELRSPLKELQASVGTTTEAPSAPATGPKPTTMDEMERAHIEETLRRTNGLIAGKGGAAEILGLPASTLRGRMKKLGIK